MLCFWSVQDCRSSPSQLGFIQARQRSTVGRTSSLTRHLVFLPYQLLSERIEKVEFAKGGDEEKLTHQYQTLAFVFSALNEHGLPQELPGLAKVDKAKLKLQIYLNRFTTSMIFAASQQTEVTLLHLEVYQPIASRSAILMMFAHKE